MRRPLLSRMIACGCLIAASFPFSDSVQSADPSLRAEVSIIADEVARFLKEQRETQIAIGEFRGPDALAATAGPTIVDLLRSELKYRGVTIARNAQYRVQGRYADVIDAQTELLAVQLTAEVTNSKGEIVLPVHRGVFGDAPLVTLLGATVQLPPGKDPRSRNNRFVAQLDDPAVFFDGSVIAADDDSPYAIEILVIPARSKEDQYVARSPVVDQGLAFVHINRDEVFAVRLINRSKHAAAVRLTIDGLNVFRFSESGDAQNAEEGRFLLPAESIGLIKGWAMSSQKKPEPFRTGRYAKHPAARSLQHETNIGTITACFSATWNSSEERPEDEPAPLGLPTAEKNDSSAPDASSGEPDAPQVGVVRAAVSVRFIKWTN